MDFKVYDYLSESAKFVRQTVFVEEQGFVNELDETDNIAMHIVLYDEKKAEMFLCFILSAGQKIFMQSQDILNLEKSAMMRVALIYG